MSEVPVRVLNQDTAGVLARVKRGEEIDITERGVVIARIVPPAPHPLADRVAAGKLRPPTAEGPIPRPQGPVRTDHESGELVSRMRDEDRYS
ncbi:type II toxin-antitoxin system Phd/YefM family antitoxin [Gandjariella thermophila]|uniref:type II toxin-antitoxin system Phd/YefM family antitoxin n=1 Tax=Gandjariella thermophila TaxID=1931992 RepID=UPI0010F79587|nr:type II toxin-antitoxin system prevent-host-death family antitoxin [Gandjariella thermophila]